MTTLFKSGFDPQPELRSEWLSLRPLRAGDLEGLHAAAADPAIWAGHPARRRHERDVFEPYFQFLLESGTTLVAIDENAAKLIGCSRYYVSPDRPDDIAIGFTFLNNAYWGGPANFKLKRLMLDHAFAHYPDVWFHIDPNNIRSQKATAKLGAEHAYDATLDLSGAPATWKIYRLQQSVWEDRRADEAAGHHAATGTP